MGCEYVKHKPVGIIAAKTGRLLTGGHRHPGRKKAN